MNSELVITTLDFRQKLHQRDPLKTLRFLEEIGKRFETSVNRPAEEAEAPPSAEPEPPVRVAPAEPEAVPESAAASNPSTDSTQKTLLTDMSTDPRKTTTRWWLWAAALIVFAGTAWGIKLRRC